MTASPPNTEGVIQYLLDHRPSTALPAAARQAAQTLDPWRTVLHRLGLVGQTPERYDGYGFGNVSLRVSESAFVISGTQTGAPQRLGIDGYALVTACDPTRNAVGSEGPVKPSSEALTHGTVYALDTEIACVLHAHSPDIWQAASALALPQTPADVPYGTPAMALAVRTLYGTTGLAGTGVFSMQGHEDGVVAFGRDCAEATQRLVSTLAAALACAAAD